MNRTQAQVSSLPGRRPRSRRALQWVLGAMAMIPLANAAAQIVRGPNAVPGGSADVAPSVDSAFRYANTFHAMVGPIVWSQLARIEQRSPILTWTLSTIFLGGLARLRSWQQRGQPHPVLVSAIGLEIVGIPILLFWQRRISSR
jgi:hypothetical protein